ncbi:MAG: hypothetical protein KF684_05745 [Phycisphaeraceae bacterium]|nr:hypothetical protein [Phycisphaeraceae bacterium]
MNQYSHSPAGMRPHRGVLVLVFGILGLVLCFLFGIAAWVMGGADLRQMDAGHMDPEGRGLTQAGKICGIIAVVLQLIGIVFVAVFFGLAILGAIAGAASQGP